jgi:hypothetical protein
MGVKNEARQGADRSETSSSTSNSAASASGVRVDNKPETRLSQSAAIIMIFRVVLSRYRYVNRMQFVKKSVACVQCRVGMRGSDRRESWVGLTSMAYSNNYRWRF